MEAKLKQGTVITATHEDGSFWKIDDTPIFTDTPESGIQTYNNEGKKLYFPKNHDLSGCGFPEDMFETDKKLNIFDVRNSILKRIKTYKNA